MTERADPDLLALYVRLYFDEDVSAGIVDNLRQRGFDVLSARDARHLRLDDDVQLAFFSIRNHPRQTIESSHLSIALACQQFLHGHAHPSGHYFGDGLSRDDQPHTHIGGGADGRDASPGTCFIEQIQSLVRQTAFGQPADG
jgi:hypothetical protein